MVLARSVGRLGRPIGWVVGVSSPPARPTSRHFSLVTSNRYHSRYITKRWVARARKIMEADRLETVCRRLHSRLPLVGRWLRRRAVRALEQDGSPDALRA